ncbi:TetR/AcrR family transcriptional regulator [bacterium]|nr:TetR/AcrR family transcriptional regulator [bacterium]
MFFKMTKNQLERKLKILKAAIKSFAASGFHISDIDNIAKNAGVGKGTLYRYFQNKEDLFFESVKYCMDEMYDEIGKKLENVCYEDFVGVLFDAHMDYYREHGETYMLVANAILQMPQNSINFFHELHKEKMKIILDKLQSGVEAGKVKNVDLEVLVKMLNLVSQIFCLTKDISPEADDYVRVKETFVSVFNHGLLNNR